MRRILGFLWVSLFGCSPRAPAQLPSPDADLGLGDVVFLSWTTRSAEGLLGHAMVDGEIAVDPLRQVVGGTPTWVPTSQHLKVLLSRDTHAGAGASVAGVGANAKLQHTTHVAYDVHLTRYLELSPKTMTYAAESGCCLGGEGADACGDYYVLRLMWGSGHAYFLQKLQGDVQVSSLHVLNAEGGSRYQKLNESTFEDTFFAYEAAPLADLCARVPPEQELAPLNVTPPNNCWAMASLGTMQLRRHAWHVPNQDICKSFVGHFCEKLPSVESCQGQFGPQDALERFSVPVAVRAEPELPEDPNQSSSEP